MTAPIVFRIRTPRGPWPDGPCPMWVLEQDRWDDYGFKTQYFLHHREKGALGEHENKLIGPVKIARLGQMPTTKAELTDDFETLDGTFVSVGQSLDYYERLSAFGSQTRDSILRALRDAARRPSIARRFTNDKVWETSLMREIPDWVEFRTLASSLVTGDYTTLPDSDLKLSFLPTDWSESLTLHFAASGRPPGSLFEDPTPSLPERVAVIIGRNGSGKSTALARLARVAHGSVAERARKPLVDIGTLEPEGLGFPRIIAVSFSPFDSFRLPGTDLQDRQQIAKEIAESKGRFIFIGLRDLVTEARDEIPGIDGSVAPIGERLTATRLKSLDLLAEEFANAIIRAQSKGRQPLLHLCWQTLTQDASFNDLRNLIDQKTALPNAKAQFLTWSTGHKITMLVLTSIVANIEPRSLVLIDEPETHLHPPLLATFMHALRKVLQSHKAFAVVATHSPVVLQETLGQHVRITRREGSTTRVDEPQAETLGENVGTLTTDVFGLHAEVTDYRKVLAELVDALKSQAEIEKLFLNGRMSQQARAFVASQLLRKKNKVE